MSIPGDTLIEANDFVNENYWLVLLKKNNLDFIDVVHKSEK